MVARPSLQAALIALGVVLLAASYAPVFGGSSDVDYVHRVEPATNGTLAYGLEYEEADVRAYEDLTSRGREAFDRARRESPYVVGDEAATPPDFTYTSDDVAVGHGLYPVRHEGRVYSLRTERRSSGFNAAAWLAAYALRVAGASLVVAGVALSAWRRWRG